MTNPNWRPFKLAQWSSRIKPKDKNKMILTPVIGKKYNCPQEVLRDWDNYHNFYMTGSGYFNKLDFESMETTHPHLKGREVMVEYRKGERCMVGVL